MTEKPRADWDAESLQKIRVVGDRRYRRMLGAVALSTLGTLAALGVWGIDFHAHTLVFLLVYLSAVLLAFCLTLFLALLDMWSVRLDFAVRRRALAQEFVQSSRALGAPRNGKPVSPKPPRL